MHEAELAFARLGLYRDEGGIPAFRIPRADLPRWAALVGEFGYMLEGSLGVLLGVVLALSAFRPRTA